MPTLLTTASDPISRTMLPQPASVPVNVPEGVDVLRPVSGAAVVLLRGEHDLATVDSMDVLLGELVAQHELVVVDVSEADFVDSSFLHCLLQADRQSRARRARFRLQMGTAPIVAKALRISGVLDVLDVVHNRHEALAPGPNPIRPG